MNFNACIERKTELSVFYLVFGGNEIENIGKFGWFLGSVRCLCVCKPSVHFWAIP